MSFSHVSDGPSSQPYPNNPFDSFRDSVPDLPGQSAYDSEARTSRRRYRSSRNFDSDTRLAPTFAQSTTCLSTLPPAKEPRVSGRFSRDSESTRSGSNGSQHSQHGRSAVSLASTSPSPNLSQGSDEEGDHLPRASYAAHMRVAQMIARQKAAQSTASLALSTEQEEQPDRNHRLFARKNNGSGGRVSRWISKFRL